MADAPATITGGCLCGAIRYTALDAGLAAYACHCTDCHTRSGSSGQINQFVPAPGFKVEGEPLKAATTTPRGATITQFACPKCLTRVYATLSDRPELVTLRSGTRDDSAGLTPAFHVWVRSKQPWITLPEGAKTFDTQPETPEEWTALILPSGLSA